MNPTIKLVYQEIKPHLSAPQKALVDDVIVVLDRIKKFDHINDYSFLVAPVSKAYEGYLKDFFFKTEIIDEANYRSDRFRVGKTLNPSLRYKRFSIYRRLAEFHENGEQLAETLWDAWKFGRNQIFHFFPDQVQFLTRDEAENRILLLLKAIAKSLDFLDQS